MNNTLKQIINNLYNEKTKQGYYSKYGSDVIIAVIIICIFFITITYYYVLNHLPLIKQNWPKNKCNPAYLPFASMVIDDKHKSNLDVIGENFDDCTKNILTTITSDALQPIYYATNVMTEAMHEMTQAVTGIRSMFNNIRVDIKDTAENISGRALNITIPVLKLIISAKNMMSSTQGTMTTAVYVLFSAYLMLKSLLGSIIEIISEIILIPLGISIVGLWATLQFPEAIATTAIFVAILVPLTIIIHKFNDTFHGNAAVPAGPPACFGKYTPIKLANNTTKYIYEIDVNDILHDGSIVTGVMQMSSRGQSTFNLDNIVVTGLHRVHHNKLGWIKVAEHPHSHEIKDYMENIVYCLNTNTKVIKINNFTFLDWDDLDDHDIEQINKNCTIIPKHLNNKDIHTYLDNGFEENTLIELEIGTQIKIKNIEVNDILKFGERVLGIIKIDSNDILTVNEYCINNSIIRCSSNIKVQLENLDILNTSNLEGNPIITNKYLYQLITNEGYFYIGNIKVYDYNVGIEKYLDNTEIYSQNLYQ